MSAPEIYRAPIRPMTPTGESLTSRIVSIVLALGLGALFGALGTVIHQVDISVFGLFDLPIGLIIALPAVALLLVGLRMVLTSRLIALLAAVALLGVVFLLSQPSAGGSVLVPANAYGYVWTFAPSAIALVVLAWPRLSPVSVPVAN